MKINKKPQYLTKFNTPISPSKPKVSILSIVNSRGFYRTPTENNYI